LLVFAEKSIPGSNEAVCGNRVQKRAKETAVADDAEVMTPEQDVLRFLTGRRVSVRPLSTFSFTAFSFFFATGAREPLIPLFIYDVFAKQFGCYHKNIANARYISCVPKRCLCRKTSTRKMQNIFVFVFDLRRENNFSSFFFHFSFYFPLSKVAPNRISPRVQADEMDRLAGGGKESRAKVCASSTQNFVGTQCVALGRCSSRGSALRSSRKSASSAKHACFHRCSRGAGINGLRGRRENRSLVRVEGG